MFTAVVKECTAFHMTYAEILGVVDGITVCMTCTNKRRSNENILDRDPGFARRLPTRTVGAYWAESRRGDGQGDVEKADQQSYRRPYDGKNQGEQKKRPDNLIELIKRSFVPTVFVRSTSKGILQWNFQKSIYFGQYGLTTCFTIT